jgi:hypothetical protein
MDQMMEYLSNEMAETKAAISASPDEMKINISANQEKMDATTRAGQEKMEAVISATQYVHNEFKETIRKQLEDLDAEIQKT